MPTKNCIYGMSVSAHKFQAVTTLNRLKQLGLRDPVLLETEKRGTLDAESIDASELRRELNRRFDKPRKARVLVFADYIKRVEGNEGMQGGTPAITLYIEKVDSIDVAAVGGYNNPDLEALCIPSGAMLITPDGETQTAARFELLKTHPETGDQNIAVTIYHSVGHNFAKQILTDYNGNAHPVKAGELALLNPHGALSQVVHTALDKAMFDRKQVNDRSIRPGTRKDVAFGQLLNGAVGYAFADGALKGAVGDQTVKALQEQATEAQMAGCADQLAALLLNKAALKAAAKQGPVIWQLAGALAKATGQSMADMNWGGVSTPSQFKQAGVHTRAEQRAYARSQLIAPKAVAA